MSKEMKKANKKVTSDVKESTNRVEKVEENGLIGSDNKKNAKTEKKKKVTLGFGDAAVLIMVLVIASSVVSFNLGKHAAIASGSTGEISVADDTNDTENNGLELSEEDKEDGWSEWEDIGSYEVEGDADEVFKEIEFDVAKAELETIVINENNFHEMWHEIGSNMDEYSSRRVEITGYMITNQAYSFICANEEDKETSFEFVNVSEAELKADKQATISGMLYMMQDDNGEYMIVIADSIEYAE